MNDALHIELIGTDALLKRFNDTKKNINKAAMLAGQQVGMKIIAEAKRNLRLNNSVVTGLLRDSGKVQKVNDGLDIGFFDTTNRSSGYAFFVEYGRRAGKMPPPDELIQWAYKKLRLDAKAAVSAGWALAKKIAKQGTKPHPYFYPAVDQELPKFEALIQKYLNHYKEFGKWQ